MSKIEPQDMERRAWPRGAAAAACLVVLTLCVASHVGHPRAGVSLGEVRAAQDIDTHRNTQPSKNVRAGQSKEEDTKEGAGAGDLRAKPVLQQKVSQCIHTCNQMCACYIRCVRAFTYTR